MSISTLLLSTTVLFGLTSPVIPANEPAVLLLDSNSELFIHDLAPTRDGCYVAGRFSGTASGPLGPENHGGTDGFLIHVTAKNSIDQRVPIGGAGNDAIARIETDSTGAVWILGIFHDRVTFAGPGEPRAIEASRPDGELFLARWRPDDGWLWARRLDLPAHVAGLSAANPGPQETLAHLEIDSKDRAWVCAPFQGTAEVHQKPDTPPLTSARLAGALLQFDADGALLVAEVLNHDGTPCWASALTVGPKNSLYLAATIQRDGAERTELQCIVQSRDDRGEPRWTREIHGVTTTAARRNTTGAAIVTDLCVDARGEVSVVGTLMSTVDFAPERGGRGQVHAAGPGLAGITRQGFRARYSSRGKLSRVDQFGDATSVVSPLQVETTEKGDPIVRLVEASSRGASVRLLRLKRSGADQWSRSIESGVEQDPGRLVRLVATRGSLAVGPGDETWLAGPIAGHLRWDGEKVEPAESRRGAFLVRVDDKGRISVVDSTPPK